VKAEANEALNSKKYIPIIMGDTKPPLLFRYIQGVIWNDTGKIEVTKFNDLVKHIKRLLGEPPKTKSAKPEVKTSKAKKDEPRTTVSESQPQKKEEPTEFDSVKIGNQIWMKENLDVDRFRNGDTISEIKSESEWQKAGENKQPAWCYYENDSANGKIFGKLYNWYAVNDARGLAPKGWHIPSDEEWTTLTDYLGGDDATGGKMKSTGTQYWNSPNKGATNESGFSGLPGGFRYDDGGFFYIGSYGYWWGSSEGITGSAWYRNLYFDGSDVYRYYYVKDYGFSVRCLRD
jgi:uncharacterized protein (TIGR02145 family)